MSPQLIGLCGRSGSGKDLVALHLREHHGFCRIAVAEPLKQATALAFDMTPAQLWGDQRNVLDDRWGRTPRMIYQELGDALRAIHPDALIRRWRASLTLALRERRRVVVPDVRTPDEVAVLRELGGTLWRIVRPGVHLAGPASEHATETTSDSFDVARVLSNVGDVAALCREVDGGLAAPRSHR